MPTAPQNVTVFAGDSAVLSVTIVDENNTALSLAGAAFAYTIAPNEGDHALVAKSTATGGVTITTAASGLVSVTLGGADTTGLLGGYWHQLVLTDGSGNISTVMTGTISFLGRS